ncbi:MAG: NAD-dependent epimerase/dehydratase family protein, partial [Deltaproteobacteria bacterium]|nr:NAD-dependent epimerase/dehydratase family protein [Deltaproteobacteria bacterium]
LEWLKRRPGPRLLYASTSEAYAGSCNPYSTPPIPTPEDVPLAVADIKNPRFSYAASKILAEAAVVAYAQASGVPAVIVRYHNVFGPRMGYEHVIPELSLRLLRRQEPFVLYGVDQSRAFCYVSDAVEGTIKAMTAASRAVDIFHIGNDSQEIVINDLLKRLCVVSGITPRTVDPRPAPPGSPARRCPDLSKARQVLGYEPQVGLDQGLKLTFDWYWAKHPQGLVEPR